jgi:hypothetical protein
MSWRIPRMWEGGEVWIIGGGPSVTEQFDIPVELVNKVKAGQLPLSELSPFMAAIHGKHVIGINVAFMIGNWIDMCFFGDNGFYLRYREQLALFPGLKVSCNMQPGRDGFVKCLDRDGGHPKGISMRPGYVSWNSNSGAAAISIAAQTGAKRIVLLGFDMKLSNDKNQHFHNVYQRGPVVDDRRMRKLPFPRHLRGFPAIAEDAKKLGIEIINCSPTSAIDSFPKYTVKQFLNEHS